MTISRETKDSRIVELYKRGVSFRKLQKHYHRSPNNVSRLVKGINVVCSSCGKPKGKVRFHSHHPDRVNQPHYTIPLCPSCHAKEEARLRRDKQNQPRTPAADTPQLINRESHPSTALPAYPPRPLSKTGKKVIVGGLITVGVLKVLPNLLDDIRRHWQQPNNSGKRPIMGLKRSH